MADEADPPVDHLAGLGLGDVVEEGCEFQQVAPRQPVTQRLGDVGRQFLWRVHVALEKVAPLFDADDNLPVLRRAFGAMPSASFSTAILQDCAPALAVMRLAGVAWSDWGSPRRVILSLRQAGLAPDWFRRVGLDA